MYLFITTWSNDKTIIIIDLVYRNISALRAIDSEPILAWRIIFNYTVQGRIKYFTIDLSF